MSAPASVPLDEQRGAITERCERPLADCGLATAPAFGRTTRCSDVIVTLAVVRESATWYVQMQPAGSPAMPRMLLQSYPQIPLQVSEQSALAGALVATVVAAMAARTRANRLMWCTGYSYVTPVRPHGAGRPRADASHLMPGTAPTGPVSATRQVVGAPTVINSCSLPPATSNG
jgi:hypothetical protein